MCVYYMEYSFADNLRIKKYYIEPTEPYNLISTVVFRLENNYKPMTAYHDKFMFMLQNFRQTVGNASTKADGSYYLRVYFDRSIYIKTDNEIINKEIDEMWLPLLKYLKRLSFVQLVRFTHLDFKKSKIFHEGLFGTIMRFLPLFDYESNSNVKTVIISDIDVSKASLYYIRKCLNYVKQKNLKFFFRTGFFKFIKGRHYTAKGIANTWLRVMAGTVICDNYKFPHVILDEFFKQLHTKIYDKNVDQFVNMDIYNYHEEKTSTEKVFKYGIDEFFAMYLVRDVLEKNLKFGYLSTKDLDAPIWFSYIKSKEFTDGKYDYEKLIRSIMKKRYDENKTLRENYQHLTTNLFIPFVRSELSKEQTEFKNNMFAFFDKIYKEKTYADFGIGLDEVKCILFQKDKNDEMYVYDDKLDNYDNVFNDA